ncbi:MAG TPA: AMP-binding protein, partial [Novosphingobium sp.]|nr:AMP-binding protein [Novosphingobium sp.]
GLYLTNRVEFIEAFLAVIKLGAIPFNVNYRYRAEELRYLFANGRAAAIIHDAQYGEILRGLRGDLADLKLCVAVADGSLEAAAGSLAYADLLESAPAGPWPRAEDDIMLTYTGGTTGMPKGVMWPHRAFFFACAGGGGHFNPHGPATCPQDIADRAAHGYPLRMFTVAPLMHAAALWTVWSALLNGLTVVLDESGRFDAAAIWQKVADRNVQLLQIVGDAMAIPLRDALRAHPGRWDLSGLVSLGSGGALFSRHVKEDLAGLLPPAVRLTDGMGSTETGVAGMAAASAEGMMQLEAGETLKVVVDDRFAVAGETGIIARSGHTPVGYFGDAEKTAEVFRQIDGRLWVISGDSGRLEADGRITVFGRGSTCINSGGEKIFPEEVEEALRAHPAIRDAVVAAQADARWGERVVGIVSLRAGHAAPALEEMRGFLGDALAGYKLPRALVWVDEVHRSPAGKQDYRWARAMAETAR